MQARMNRDTLLGILRHFLTVAGGGLVANGTTTSSELEQGIGAILTLVGIAWSIWSKRQAARTSGSSNGAITLLAVIAPALILLSGCATTGSGDQAITPARVEKITRLAVWTTATGWTVKQPESTPKFRAALKGIDALVAEENWDVVALASALTASGENAFTGPEGRLIVSGTTLLIDTFAGDKVDLRKVEYAKSVVLGAQAGLRLALGVSAQVDPPPSLWRYCWRRVSTAFESAKLTPAH